MKIHVRPQTNTIFRALSDQTRLQILQFAPGAGRCAFATSFTVLEVPQPTASRHLSYLRRAGLVIARKEGLWMHYRLTSAQSKSHTKLLECLAQCFREECAFAKDKERLRTGVGSCGS